MAAIPPDDSPKMVAAAMMEKKKKAKYPNERTVPMKPINKVAGYLAVMEQTVLSITLANGTRCRHQNQHMIIIPVNIRETTPPKTLPSAIAKMAIPKESKMFIQNEMIIILPANLCMAKK